MDYILLDKNRYTKLKLNKLVKFKSFIDIDLIFNLSIDFFSYPYSKYNNSLYF